MPVQLICMHLNIRDVLVKLAEIDLLLKPVTSAMVSPEVCKMLLASNV